MKKSLLYTGVASSIALLLAGCTTYSKKNEADINANIDQGRQFYAERSIKPLPGLVEHSNRVFLSAAPRTIEAKRILPPVFNNKIVYAASSGEGLEQMLHDLSQMSGVQIRVTDDARSWINDQEKKSKTPSSYNFNDTLDSILSNITSDYSLSWTYKDGVVQVYRLVTAIYSLDVPVGSYKFSNDISSTGNGGQAGSTGSAVGGNSNMTMNYGVNADNPWESAIKTITNMLSPAGKLDASPTEGYLTVTDTPVIQAKVKEYVDKVNLKTNKKIAIRVDVYDVQTSADTNFGLQLKALLNAGGFHINWASGLSNQPAADAAQFLFSNSSQPNAGNQSILTALNSLGRTARVVGSTVYTVSGQPAPIQSSQSQGYIKSITRNYDNTGNTNNVDVSVQQDTLNTGYNLTLTPRIQSNNQILLNLNLQISSLTKLKSVGENANGGSTSANTNSQSTDMQIQLPTVQNKSFMETMALKSGQSLLLAGFQETNGSSDTNSMGPEQAWVVGGNKQTSNTKSTTVVVVTPYIIGG